ncbi:MAG: hypothetical protein JRC99_11830 [Deltaproteobacteria bacterium]|nr:hypothetical protein [Deltaproteobacteria bacterium]
MNAPAQLSLDDLLRTTVVDKFEKIKAELEFAQAVANPQAFGLGVNDVRYLIGPVVEHSGGWGVGILRKLIPTARLKLILSGEKNLCTLEEALGYYSTASFSFPLARDDAEVMFWLSQEVFEGCGAAESVHEILGLPKRIELSDYRRDYTLNPLRRKIRTSVVKNAKRKSQ